MSQNFPVNNFEWIEDTSRFKEDFIKIYKEGSGIGYFLEFDVQYSEKIHELHNDLPFLPERMQIEKVEKLITSSHDKNEHVTFIENLKQALK